MAGISGVIPAGTGQQSVTLTVPSSITGDLYVLLTTSSAVTFDGPSKRSGVQIEFGTFATVFERRIFSDELIRCQRFYEKSFDLSVQPAADVAAHSYTETLLRRVIDFKVMKRTSPTLTFFRGSGSGSAAGSTASQWAVFNGSNWVPATPASLTVSQSACTVSMTSSASISSSFLVEGNWVADGRF